MKNKHTYRILLILISFIFLLISIPVIYLIYVKVSETSSSTQVFQNYSNDQSRLNHTKVHKIIDVKVKKDELKQQIQQLINYANTNNLKISIAGTKHSMGGHTIYPDGIVINMLPYNHMEFDEANNILTIGSGATWEQALKFLDHYDKSIAVMQSFSNFSIGGSISVNGHGWQKNAAPISSYVESFTLINATGEILECSRSNNPELFKLAIGGYGLFGIILDVKLKVIDNSVLNFHSISLNPEDYAQQYEKLVTQNPKAELAYGRLRISDKKFLEQATLNYFEKNNDTPQSLTQQNYDHAKIRRIVFRSSVENEYGKRLRWDLENMLNKIAPLMTYTRNEILIEDSSLIENKDINSTDLLHEYFIPKKNLAQFIHEIKPILKQSNLDLLNITIREIKHDNDAFLNYAREDVFGLVFLFNQKKTQIQEHEMEKLTNQLFNIALKNQGTYYLPYRLHISAENMRLAYPQANQFFQLKKKYDDKLIFNNQFYLHYSLEKLSN